jgi:putative flippase GtrA
MQNPSTSKQTLLDKISGIKQGIVFRYSVVGVLNTVFGFSFFPVFYWFFHDALEINILVTLSHACCVAVSYLLHRFVTFQSKAKVHLELGKFLSTQCVTWCINLVMLNIALQWLTWSPFVLQMLISVLITVGNYFVYRYFVFAKKTAASIPKEIS